MGSPQKPKTPTIRRLYYRLNERPFWVGDYKSIGIKSYGTVNEAVKFLFGLGLVRRRREGHKVLYELPTDSRITNWWPLLTTEKERENLEKESIHERETWVADFLDDIKPGIRAMGRIGTLLQDALKQIEINLSNSEIIKLIYEVDRKMNYIEILEKWNEVVSYQLCPECLAKRKKFVRTIVDDELGEIVCEECALVISVDNVQRTYDSRPSPFTPPI